jgi:hypothetical protein
VPRAWVHPRWLRARAGEHLCSTLCATNSSQVNRFEEQGGARGSSTGDLHPRGNAGRSGTPFATRHADLEYPQKTTRISPAYSELESSPQTPVCLRRSWWGPSLPSRAGVEDALSRSFLREAADLVGVKQRALCRSARRKARSPPRGSERPRRRGSHWPTTMHLAYGGRWVFSVGLELAPARRPSVHVAMKLHAMQLLARRSYLLVHT